jgi:phosphoribosylamine--glycine ligase/phosphoribosylformylglycinamidine cyclo-ligase
VCGPEQPLVDGISDIFKKNGIPLFGPSKYSAQLEGSKAFAKEFMSRNNIPTASFKTFSDFEAAKKYVMETGPNLVIKVFYFNQASGLAGGKGVYLPDTTKEAVDALKSIMVDSSFGNSGDQVVIEERLFGQEISCLAFTDGYTVVPLPGAQDHKRVFDGDKGPNTGGMGCFAPVPFYTPELQNLIKKTILQPTIDGMRLEGCL